MDVTNSTVPFTEMCYMRGKSAGAIARSTRKPATASNTPAAPLIAESKIALPDDLPPMAAGVFGYLGYDTVRLMEDLPASHPDPIGIRMCTFDVDPGIRPSVRAFVDDAAPWEPVPEDGLHRFPQSRHAKP